MSLPQEPSATGDGIRPLNLRTDLAALADLIELVFADTMDNSGRAALREMRVLSRITMGLNVMARLNEMALGIKMGYVWVEDGKLVGNVSLYPANWHPQLGNAWIIANVGVHPGYRRQGIARQLMRASLDMIQQRGGNTAILQVDYDNYRARNLYTQLGFIEERAWSLWRRPPAARLPPVPLELNDIQISHLRRAEWRAEYALAQRVRPTEMGGVGWLRPLHLSLFRPSLARWLRNVFSLRSIERLVIRSADERHIHAALWIETGFTSSSRLTLLVDQKYAGVYDEALISTAVRRYGGDALILEHPHDENITNTVLERYRFSRQRTILHMRWDGR